MFIGCACDRKFVEHTAVMLTSVASNGQVPEASVLVAGFGLTDEDQAVLRAGAGPMGDRLQVIAVTRDRLHEIDRGGYTDSYPVSVLGRLFIAEHIDVPGARLLTVDSDMIVNVSLRPLFELDLQGEFFAAIHDPPRRNDLNYFNSGLMLVDVDDYKRHDIARRALRWLAEQSEHPAYPDQDALNEVVGHCWRRLDRTWNFFFFEDERFTTEGYEGAKVAHFAGPKPWDYADHPGAPLYNRHLSKLRARLDEALIRPPKADRDFIATCYEILLGREMDPADAVVRDRLNWPTGEVVRSVMRSDEFRTGVLAALEGEARALPHENRSAGPTVRQRFWAVDRLGVSQAGAVRLEAAVSWREWLAALLCEPGMGSLIAGERAA